MNPPDESDIDFLLLMEDYQHSFTEAYLADPTLSSLPYGACAERLFSRPIYYGDAYVDALASLGLAAEQVVPFCRPLQFKWTREQNMWALGQLWTRLPVHSPAMESWLRFPDTWILNRIIARQIAVLRPKVVWVFSGVHVTDREIRGWRRYVDHVILWWSCPLWNGFPYTEFDLALTTVPSFVSYFEELGVHAAHLPHAFDPRILDRVRSPDRRALRAAFVGSLSASHTDRISLLDSLSRKVPLDFYGHGVEFLPPDSPLRRSYCGPAWGDDLYSVYGSHLVVVHKSADVWTSFTSAKRLFEATGMGACVVTEYTDDLANFFEPDVEVVTYSSPQECIGKVEHLLEDPDEARTIGRRAQERTLRDHTYRKRVRELYRQLESFQLIEARGP